jgi:hypothetical protein
MVAIASIALANTKTETYTYVKEVVEVEPAPIETEPEMIERLIREAFEDAPIMVQVARCESGFRNVPSKTGDHGPFQINQVHLDRLQELGLDRTVIEDNIKYARMLYDESGTQSWYMSKHCWSK